MNLKHLNLKTIFLSIVTLLLVTAGVAKADMKEKTFTLKNIHQNIVDDYKSVKHISRQKLIEVLGSENRSDVLIFDVREKEEFIVSHLKGAKQLSPSIWKSSFLKKYGEQVKGKKIIFYCSVGVRSTKMADYLSQSLKEQGAKEIYNLEEGIFGWANKGQALFKSAAETTTKVHPYNSHWGQLIKEESIKSYVP
jgi:rhodanese-related sulfurtransferase